MQAVKCKKGTKKKPHRSATLNSCLSSSFLDRGHAVKGEVCVIHRPSITASYLSPNNWIFTLIYCYCPKDSRRQFHTHVSTHTHPAWSTHLIRHSMNNSVLSLWAEDNYNDQDNNVYFAFYCIKTSISLHCSVDSLQWHHRCLKCLEKSWCFRPFSIAFIAASYLGPDLHVWLLSPITKGEGRAITFSNVSAHNNSWTYGLY